MLVELTKEEFNSFSSKHKNSIFFESSYWGELKKTTGWISYFVGYKTDKLEAATLILAKKIPIINKYIFYAPRGFLIDYKDFDLLKKFTEEITKFVKKKKGIFYKINPLVIYQERDINGDIVNGGENNKDVVDYLKKLGYSHVGLTNDYGKDIEPRWISVLDLKDKTYDDIYNNYNKLKKRHMKSISKLNFKLTEIDKSRMEEYKKMMSSTSVRRGFIDRPLTYYNNMYEIFKPSDIIKIMFVEINFKEKLDQDITRLNELKTRLENENNKLKANENLINELSRQIESINKTINEDNKYIEKYGDIDIPISSGLFMSFGPEVVYLFGANYEEFMNLNGATYLMDQMIRYAIDNGYERYNFYGITGHFESDHPMYGLFDFKRGFGAHVEELIGEFTYIVNKFDYVIYKIMKKCYSIIKKVKK